MTNQNATATETKIAADLDLCDLGMALTSGKLRKRYATHRKACFAALKQMNEEAGLSEMSDDELLAALAE